MKKLFCNGCEDLACHAGVTQLRTSAFTPGPESGQLVDLINELYDDSEPLLVIKNHEDGTAVLTASTYLLTAYTDMDYGEFEVEAFDSLIDEFRAKYGETVETLKKIVLTAGSDSVPVGDLLPPMITSGQSVVVQLTDLKHGNSEFTLET